MRRKFVLFAVLHQAVAIAVRKHIGEKQINKGISVIRQQSYYFARNQCRDMDQLKNLENPFKESMKKKKQETNLVEKENFKELKKNRRIKQ